MGKKIIFSLLAICLIAGMVGVGTWAYFSDIETSPQQFFQAGTLDLVVDKVNGPPVTAYFSVGNLQPGDWERQPITLSNIGSLDGSAYIHIIRTMDEENFAWEPEIAAGDVEDVEADNFDGELGQNLLVTILADLSDPLDGIYETPVAEGSLVAPLAPPVIDGTVDPGEWDGATVIDVAGDMGTVSVIAETDYLYVLFDVLDSTDARKGENIHGNDQTSININPTPGAPWGLPCDIIFQTGADPAAWGGTSSGTTDLWETDWEIDGVQLSLPGDLETKTLYDYDTGTRISEWKIPLASIAPSLGDTLKLGGAIDVGDGSSYVYPVDLDWGDAGSYAPLTLLPPGMECTTWPIGALKAESEIGLMIRWEVPGWVGNTIQSDICMFDIDFTLEQGVAALDADFTYAPPEPGIGEEITFTSITKGGVTPYICDWDFTYVELEGFNKEATGPVVTHSYVTAVNQVCLRVTDNEGTVDFEDKPVAVRDMPPVITNISPEPNSLITIGDIVTVSAEVTDDVDLATWEAVGNAYEGVLPGAVTDKLIALGPIPAVGYAIDPTGDPVDFLVKMVPMPNVGGNTYSADWDTFDLPDGPHVVGLSAVDTILQSSDGATSVTNWPWYKHEVTYQGVTNWRELGPVTEFTETVFVHDEGVDGWEPDGYDHTWDWPGDPHSVAPITFEPGTFRDLSTFRPELISGTQYTSVLHGDTSLQAVISDIAGKPTNAYNSFDYLFDGDNTDPTPDHGMPLWVGKTWDYRVTLPNTLVPTIDYSDYTVEVTEEGYMDLTVNGTLHNFHYFKIEHSLVAKTTLGFEVTAPPVGEVAVIQWYCPEINMELQRFDAGTYNFPEESVLTEATLPIP